MNTSATPFIPCLTHRFNGHSNNSPKRRRLFWTRRDGQMHSCNPKKHRCVFWGWDQASEDGGYTVLILPASVTRWKRQITSVTEQLSWCTVKWKSQGRASSKVKKKNKKKHNLFLLFPYILFETLLTDAGVGFCKLPHNQKGTWKPRFDVSFRHILSLICLINSTLWEETVTVQIMSHKKKEEKKQGNCVESSRFELSVGLRCVVSFLKGSSRSLVLELVKLARSLYKHTNSLMLLKNWSVLIKIQHANNMHNHRSECDLRVPKKGRSWILSDSEMPWLIGSMTAGWRPVCVST